MYQCLSGRPPLLESDEHTTRQKIVTFHEGSSSGTVDALFLDSHGAGIQDAARELITQLLERNPARRPSMGDLASFEFFSGCNIFTLHRQSAHPLNVGSVAPKPDAQWSRRQMSSIWSPQPVAYNIAMPDDNVGFECKTGDHLTPFTEGDEASGSFTPFATSGPIGLARLTEGGSTS
jgi:serine/threonine protein kinase